MRNEMPMRWIEQAESRRVLTQLLAERMPVPSRCGVTRDVVCAFAGAAALLARRTVPDGLVDFADAVALIYWPAIYRPAHGGAVGERRLDAIPHRPL